MQSLSFVSVQAGFLNVSDSKRKLSVAQNSLNKKLDFTMIFMVIIQLLFYQCDK